MNHFGPNVVRLPQKMGYCRAAKSRIQSTSKHAAVFALAGLTLACCSSAPPPTAQNQLSALRDQCIAQDLVSCESLCQHGDPAACNDYKLALCERGGSCVP
jgi:hypothetical protein